MITIERVKKSYGDFTLYRDFSLIVPDGEILCVLGESGSGKTTLLNMLAGLTDYEGRIEGVGKVSYLFQEPRLLPNLTVEKNLKLVDASEVRILKWLLATSLYGKEKKYPQELSGGERQRVALARAFLYGGDTFLLDEPFSSLDLKLKISLLKDFLTLVKEEKKTTVFVTHNVEESLYAGDRIVVLRHGGIIADFKNEKTVDYFADSPVKDEIRKVLLS